MKNIKAIMLTIVAALVVSGCIPKPLKKLFAGKKDNEKQLIEEPAKSKAKESKWDFYLIGSWQYDNNAKANAEKHNSGIETFYGDGTYNNFTFNSEGKKLVEKGTWKLDDKEEYTLWVDVKSVATASGSQPSSERKKYIVYMLEPQKQLIYRAGDTERKATWVGASNETEDED